jgi:hypothetical protein
MTEKHYTNAGTLADVLEFGRSYKGSERAAWDWVLRQFRNGDLISDPPLPSDARFTSIAGWIMVETREALLDAASFRVGRLQSDPVKLEAAKPTPSELAAIDAMFPARLVIEASAGPPVETEPVPAPKPPRGPRQKPVFKELIQPRMEKHAAKAGLFDTLDAAVDDALQVLEGERREWVSRPTLKRWLRPYAGKWFKFGGKRRKLKGHLTR